MEGDFHQLKAQAQPHHYIFSSWTRRRHCGYCYVKTAQMFMVLWDFSFHCGDLGLRRNNIILGSHNYDSMINTSPMASHSAYTDNKI